MGSKRTWTTPERHYVREKFKTNYRKNTVPKLDECQDIMDDSFLQNRTSVQIQTWIRADMERKSSKNLYLFIMLFTVLFRCKKFFQNIWAQKNICLRIVPKNIQYSNSQFSLKLFKPQIPSLAHFFDIMNFKSFILDNKSPCHYVSVGETKTPAPIYLAMTVTIVTTQICFCDTETHRIFSITPISMEYNYY